VDETGQFKKLGLEELKRRRELSRRNMNVTAWMTQEIANDESSRTSLIILLGRLTETYDQRDILNLISDSVDEETVNEFHL